MAALTERDIKLLFEAETKGAARNVTVLGRAIHDLKDEIVDQAAAAAKGEGSLESLKASYASLKGALDEVARNQGFVQSLSRAEQAQKKQEDRVAELIATYEQLKAQYDSSEKKGKTLTNQVERASVAVEKAKERLTGLQTATQAAGAALEAAGGDAANWRVAQEANVEQTRQIAQALGVASNAIDNYEANLKAASGVRLEAQTFDGLAGSSNLLPQQIAYISQFENRIELLRQAMAEVSAQDATFGRALAAQDAKVGADRIRQQTAAIEEGLQAQQRLETLAGFRKVADDAVVAANNTDRFAASSQSAGSSVNRLADQVLALTAPSAAAAASLSGVAAEIERSEAILSKKGGARITEYQDQINELSRAMSTLNSVARDIDGFRAQETAVNAAKTKFAEAQAEVGRLATALRDPLQASDQLATELTQASAALDRAGEAVKREETKLDQLSASLKRAEVNTEQLGVEQTRLVGQATRAGDAMTRLNQKVGGRGATPGFLGLKPYELQNLGYQVQDVISSLASGIPVTQVIAQQGFQIASIFPNVFTLILAKLPLVLGLAAAFGAVFVAVNEVVKAQQSLADGASLFKNFGDAAQTSAVQVQEAVQAMRDLGASREDAKSAVQGFLQSGLDQDELASFAINAQAVADISGKTLPEAMKLATDAFAGGFDEVVKLNDQFPFLTEAELAQIEAMYESGNASDARTLAYEKFRQKGNEVSNDQNGPWSNAWVNFKAVAASFFSYLASTSPTIAAIRFAIGGLVDVMNNAVVGLNYLLLRARGLSHEAAGIAAVQNNGRIPAVSRGGDPRSRRETGGTRQGRAAVRAAEEETAFATASLDTTKATNRERLLAITRQRVLRDENNKTYSLAERNRLAEIAQEKLKAGWARQDEKRGAAAAKRGASAAKREAREAETAARQRNSLEDQLSRSLEQAESRASRSRQNSLTDRLAGIEKEYLALYRKLDEFAKKFGAGAQINGVSQAEYRTRLQAAEEDRKTAAQLEDYEQSVNALVKKRDTMLASIEERQKANAITAVQAQAEILEVTSKINPEIQTALDKAEAFIRTLAPTPELEQLLSKIRSISLTTGQGNASPDARKGAEGLRSAELGKLNTLVQQRDSLIAAQQALVEAGTISQEQANVRIAAAFQNTTTEILAQRDAVRALLDAQLAAGVIVPQVYDAILAKLQLVTAQTAYIPENVRRINEAAQGAFAQGFTQMFNTLGQGLANLITGTGDVGEALADLGIAALSFAADFLKAMADVLIQMLAIQAVKAVFGGGFGGGIGGFLFHSGTGSVGSYGAGAMSRSSVSASPGLLAALPRYHSGTPGVGLSNDETMAVLKRGEAVLTEDDPNHPMNANKGGAGAGQAATPLRQVLVFGDDQVAGAMAGPAGEDVTITHIRRNAPMIRQLLGA